MSTDVHARIAAAVAERREEAEVTHLEGMRVGPRAHRDADFILAACDHADKVLARHTEYATTDLGYWCAYDRKDAPCPEVRDLADLWLGEGWES